MAKSRILRPELDVYARDASRSTQHSFSSSNKRSPVLADLFGGLTIYLAGAQADFLRGRFVGANWDVDELERYGDQIVEHGLLKNQPFKGDLGPGGHPFVTGN
jgi:hypothetical protein